MPIKKILPPIFCVSLLLTGVTACQPNNDDQGSMESQSETAEHLTPSSEAQALIRDFKAEYVTRALNQQESQMAASNAMQVADDIQSSDDSQDALDPEVTAGAPVSDPAGTEDNQDISNSGSAINIAQSDSGQDDATQADDDVATVADDSNNNNNNNSSDNGSDSSDANNNNGANDESDSQAEEDEPQTEVQKKAQEEIEAEREAKLEPLPIDELNDPEKHPLPLATIIIPPPEELTAEQIEARYHQAMYDLYLPKEVLLPPQSADTLLSVATLTPDLFKNPELARRLTLKSPAMARLLRQYQVWEQIEAQQSIELAELKVAQREAQEAQKKKFEELMTEFDKTIKGYDEQIAKYEELLKQFE